MSSWNLPTCYLSDSEFAFPTVLSTLKEVEIQDHQEKGSFGNVSGDFAALQTIIIKFSPNFNKIR